MGVDIVERDDISVYLVAGVPKSFKRKLQKFVEKEAKEDGDVYMLDDELAEWVISRIRNEKRGGRDRTPASAALWRAYAALSAARYHLQHSPVEEGRVRTLRNQVEEIWRELSPMFEEEGAGEGEGGESEGGESEGEDAAEAPDSKAADKPEAKKAEAKKPEAKKPEAKKPEAKKPEAKKPEAKKAEAKKPAAKKSAKKAEAKKPAKKSAGKKSDGKKSAAKKSGGKKSTAKKSGGKKSGKPKKK